MTATEDADDRLAAVRDYLLDEGYEEVKYEGLKNNELTFIATDKYGIEFPFTTVTTWYSREVIGAQNLSNYSKSNLPEAGMSLVGTGSEFLKVFEADDVHEDNTTVMVFTFNVKEDDQKVTLTITGEDGKVYEENWSQYKEGYHRFYINVDNASSNAGDEFDWTGKLPNGNYKWTVTEAGSTIASGTFTMDR